MPGEAVDERTDGDAIAVGEKDVVGAEDEVARRAFFGDGGDDLLDLSLHFSLDISFSKEKGLFLSMSTSEALYTKGVLLDLTKYTVR